MAVPFQPASRPPVPRLALTLLAVLAAPFARAEDPPAPADPKLQATLNAVGHLAADRPEGLIALVAVTTAKKETTSMSAIEFATLDPPIKGSFAAVSMIGVKDGLTAIALHRIGVNNAIWIGGDLPIVRRIRDPELDRELLSGIEDGRKIPTMDDNPDEYRAYLYVITHAHDVPMAAMAKAAKPEITYAHMLEAPNRYRGEIVSISGKLKQLRKWVAPRQLWNDGIKDFYEGVIVSDVSPNCPYWVAFTELPSSIKVGESIDYNVTGYGYFFKRTYLEVKDRGRVRAPLVVARTVALQKAPPPPPDESFASFLHTPIAIVLIALIPCVGLAIFLLIWFRRGDKVVRSRLAEARSVNWVAPVEGPAEPPRTEPRN